MHKMGVLLFYWKRLYPELEKKRENSLYYLQSLLFPPGGPLGAVCIRDMTSLTSSHKSRIFKTRITTLLSQGLALLVLTLGCEWHLKV